jgi:hypothetical protein
MSSSSSGGWLKRSDPARDPRLIRFPKAMQPASGKSTAFVADDATFVPSSVVLGLLDAARTKRAKS